MAVATSRAYASSLNPLSANATENVWSGRPSWRAMIAAMALLSMPPERNTPSGTSLMSRRRTDSSSNSRNRADGLRVRAAALEPLSPSPEPGFPHGNIPVLLNGRLAVFEDQRVTGQQFLNAAKHGLAARDGSRAEQLGNRADVRFGVDQAAGENRLDLGSEDDPIAAPRPVERLHAEPIAREEEPAFRRIPDREGEHAAEAGDAVVAPLLVRVHDRFGIGVRAVLVPEAFEHLPHRCVVVDPPLKTIHCVPSSFERGWRPPARSTMLRRRWTRTA